MVKKSYVKYDGKAVPAVFGSGGGGKGGRDPVIAPNSLFSTDILFVLLALGEGPIYRINPNGPQDIQIQDSSINDLVNLDTDGGPNTEKFFYVGAVGSTSQKPLPYFGSEVVTAQSFSSPVSLKKGNITGVPSSSVSIQETSPDAWDSLRFNFLIDSLVKGTPSGDVLPNSVTIKISLFDYLGTTLISTTNRTITGKSDTSLKLSVTVPIPEDSISSSGYRFTIEKTSDDVDDSRIFDSIKVIGWDEIKNDKLAYPRTALIGIALKAVNEHQGGVPNFTSWLKGMIVKVPSNYNQPTLANSEIDWRHIEVPETGSDGYTTRGYYLQDSGSTTIRYDANPNIYKGVWDGTFVYSWTQNPVWIIYDILTNKVYGLGIPEENIDKYAFYRVAMYCDACDFYTGNFIGVDGLSDGSFRSKPLGTYSSVRENQVGLPKGIAIKERRFICDVTITDQNKGIDTLNELAAAIRSIIIYSGGKISLATDMPDEYPAMIFNEANIKKGSLTVSGYKLSDVLTSVDVSYMEPTNHFIREVVRVDANEVNNGNELSEAENNLNIDLKGVTRRSQALRAAQYLLAASRYQKRSIAFTTGTEAMYLSPGDLISLSTTSSGINYGYGGRVRTNSAIGESSNTYVYLEHYTNPVLSNSVITNNTYPIALRITKKDSDRTDLYIVSNTDFTTSNAFSSFNDYVDLKVLQKYDPITKTFGSAISSFSANTAPVSGDLWSFGEITNPLNFYTSKAGRLFKVKDIKRTDKEEIEVGAVEYIPEIYEDSDSFINYEPTSYVDTVNYLEVPPTPKLVVSTIPRRRSDGSIAMDAKMSVSTPTDKFYTDFSTEYSISNPEASILINNVTVGDLTTVYFNNDIGISNNQPAVITGKNGFSTSIGSIPVLCNAVSTANLGFVTFTVEGLSELIDDNFDAHILEVNDGDLAAIPKGADGVVLPIIEKSNTSGLLNFVGYADNKRLISREITGYDIANNKIIVEDTVSGLSKLSNKLPTPPFYITLSQVLQVGEYNSNSFYVEGYRDTYVKEGSITSSAIDLDVRPRNSAFVRFYVDGILKNTGQYTLNINDGIRDANIVYSAMSSDTTYRAEVDFYLPPIIEAGDTVEDDYGNTYVVSGTSYDFNNPYYNVQLTANSVFKIQTIETPIQQLTGQRFINVTNNPEGLLTNVTSNSATFTYNSQDFPGNLYLANAAIYNLAIGSDFELISPESDSVIKDLPIGVTTIRARNKNLLGRTSKYTEKSIIVETIPIQKVENIEIIESLYREQSGGVSVRITCVFDHILNQEVTDYEISYRIDNVEDELGKNISGITAFNTVKLPASGVGSDGKMRFTVNNVDRGTVSGTNTITVKVTPLNKDIRGKTSTINSAILGKTVPPDNVFNFGGGQQIDQITLFWTYPRVGDQLKDLDLKEVVIRRAAGNRPIDLDTYATATDYVTVSAGTARKSIPIDFYGTYTYLARTRDTSDILSTDVVGTVITSVRPQRSTIVKAYSEDDPSVRFSALDINTNVDEYYYPSVSNSNTSGIAFNSSDSPFDSSLVDNANGSSSGWSVVVGAPTDLIADTNAEYITQIRDVGTTITATISLDIEANQVLQSTYNDQKTVYLSGVSEPSTVANVLIDVDFGGIGHVLGFSNVSVPSARYDSNNRTWMTGGASGNVWAIWSPASTGEANANSYALIAGVINANAIALGESYFANGDPTYSNALANITTVASNYQLVNLIQYSDISVLTYQGDLGAISSQTFIRTSTANSVYYANGNVNISTFDNYQVNDGWVPYAAGSKTFKSFQLKYNIINSDPDVYDVYLDRFRYTVDKEQTITSNTVTFSSSPMVVDYVSSNFLATPVVSYAVLDQIDAEANPAIVVTTALSNQSVSFKLFASDGTGEYNANSTANVMVTVVGV